MGKLPYIKHLPLIQVNWSRRILYFHVPPVVSWLRLPLPCSQSNHVYSIVYQALMLLFVLYSVLNIVEPSDFNATAVKVCLLLIIPDCFCFQEVGCCFDVVIGVILCNFHCCMVCSLFFFAQKYLTLYFGWSVWMRISLSSDSYSNFCFWATQLLLCNRTILPLLSNHYWHIYSW